MEISDTVEQRRTPCGRLSFRDEYQDRDDEVLLSRETVYGCGCRVTHHEYHDGTLSRTVVRHDGVVLHDELLWAQ